MKRFCLVRILGNDLPPLHAASQTRDNLAFILEHEPLLPGCEKLFVLNRIADVERRRTLMDMLDDAGVAVLEIPFEPGAYRQCRDFSQRMLYVTNSNPARNLALDAALLRAGYALPFDGQLFFTATAWQRLVDDVDARPQQPVFVVPMHRVHDNDALLSQPDAGLRTEFEASEPQLMFAAHACDRFDPALPYGLAPKVELLYRLGVAGPWDRWPAEYFRRLRARAATRRSPNYGGVSPAGHVFRLGTGGNAKPGNIVTRNVARADGLRRMIAHLDALYGDR